MKLKTLVSVDYRNPSLNDDNAVIEALHKAGFAKDGEETQLVGSGAISPDVILNVVATMLHGQQDEKGQYPDTMYCPVCPMVSWDMYEILKETKIGRGIGDDPEDRVRAVIPKGSQDAIAYYVRCAGDSPSFVFSIDQ